MPEADDNVLTAIRDYVLQPAIVEGAIVDAVEALRPQLASLLAVLKAREAQRAHLQRELQTLDGVRQVSQVDAGRIARDLRGRLTGVACAAQAAGAHQPADSDQAPRHVARLHAPARGPHVRIPRRSGAREAAQGRGFAGVSGVTVGVASPTGAFDADLWRS